MSSAAVLNDPTEEGAERLAVPHVLILGLVHLFAIPALFMPSWQGLAFLIVGHILTGLGVSVGYHRLLAHRGFKAHPIAQGFFALMGTFSLQAGPITWAAFHRAHHANSDQEGDPHSSARGFWFSHLGWMFVKKPNGFRRSKIRAQLQDLEASSWLRFLDRNVLWINLGAAVAFYLLTQRLDWTLWAFPLRIVALWHCTWLVNSASHGAARPREYRGDTSKNLWWVAALTYGEGWHANHHSSPKSWKFQREWYQLDPGAIVVSALRFLRLAR